VHPLLHIAAKGSRSALLTLGCVVGMAVTAKGQTTFYWDRTSGSGAGTGSTLNGTWDTATQNWNTNSSGSGSRNTFTSGGNAVFSASTSATGQTYTITVSGTQNASSVTIEEGIVTFSGGTAINFNDASPDFTVASGLTTTVSTNITGTNGLNKLGAGTLIFGSNDKSYSGTTTISAGTLDLAFNQSFDTLALAGGTLKLSSTSTTITTLNVTANSTIDFGGTDAALNLTNFNISAGVTLNIINWVDAADSFVTQNWTGASFDTTGAIPMNQVVFNSPTFSGDNTKWQSYDKQITPVPEPSAYGALLLGLGGSLVAWRRRTKQ